MLGLREVVEEVQVGHPEVVVVEPETVETVLLPVCLADGEDREAVLAGSIVDEPERPLSGARLPAPHVLAMGIDH